MVAKTRPVKKTKSTQVRGATPGKPSELCRLNLDVLSIIASYTQPIDILNLARTCKYLRQLLIDKSSEFIWKAARKQVWGLPACPPELTEREYANLLFNARCHGCGKYTTTILWNIRRRYCPGCRVLRLRRLSSCNEVIRKNNVLAEECVAVKKEFHMRVDKEHAASFMNGYQQSSDKQQFIADKRKQRSATLLHAKECRAWLEQSKLEHKRDKQARRMERYRAIFRRLEQLGYALEISYFGRSAIRRSRERDFKADLTDKEWDKIQPAWVEIMNKFRSRRLKESVPH